MRLKVPAAAAVACVTLLAAPAGHRSRTGVVTSQGTRWVDAGGEFYPLGATLFWALRGWKFERQRLRQNLEFLARHDWDYVRILGEVGWPGNEIDPRWDDYERVLGEFIDASYDEYGLRTELTLIGGGTGVRPTELARKVLPVLATRTHKLMNLEVANEAFQNYPQEQELLGALRALQAGLPNLAAVSAPNGTPKAMLQATTRYIASGARLATVHLPRSQRDADGAWAHVRRGWAFRGQAFPISHNEPGGPRSSVRQFDEPLHLVMSRAVGIMSGIGAYVLHNGAGVAGRVEKRHDRPANLWEVPGIEAVMTPLRQLDGYLPRSLAEGVHHERGDPRHPLPADASWLDAPRLDHGVASDFAVTSGDRFVVMPIGIKGWATMTAREACELRIVDPVTGASERRTLEAGESFRLEPRSKDRRGLGAFVIVGTRVHG